MSDRLVWPYVFTLQAASLVAAYRRGADIASVAPTIAISAFGPPVALRWLTTPELGFPRRPFQVWRRARTDIPGSAILNLLPSSVQVNGIFDIPFPPAVGKMYFVAFTVSLATNQALSILAYDYKGNPIPGLSEQTLASGTSLFATPGIAGLRVWGAGTLASVYGVNQQIYANLPGWQLIQVVGLPVKPGELGAHYDSAMKQGYALALTTGYVAAYERLLIADLCRDPPPATGQAGFALPPWPPSLPLQYLGRLRSSGNLFGMISDCLEHSVDASPTKMQSLYVESVNIAGITQANLPPGQTPPPKYPSTAKLPVVGVSMMGVGTDSDAATALGYGTIDLPALDDYPYAGRSVESITFAPDFAAPVALNASYDYMVTAPYVFPGGLTALLAALSQPAAPVQPASSFLASLLVTHAVISRDTAAQVAVELTWSAPSVPQAFGLLVSRAPGTSAVLNTPRKPPVFGYDPYLGLAPQQPAPGQTPADAMPNYKDAAGTLPVTGNAVTNYLAAGIDVFGRWSSWSPASVSLAAATVTQPGLRSIVFTAGTLPSSGSVVPYMLSIEVAWNWTDRSPGVTRLTGRFVGGNAGLGPPYLSGFAMSNDGQPGPPVLLTWDYGANDPATIAPNQLLPILDSAHSGTVILASDAGQAAGAQLMRYRVTLQGLSLDFAAADELYLAIYATACEEIRPGEWSSPIDPNAPATTYIGRIVRVHNPLPPNIVFNPPAINWTALPDALHKAHGILQWTADPSAAGYMVWEATESALLQTLSPNAPNPDPAATMVARGQTLKTLIENNYQASLSSFARLNTTPIAGSSYEVELPGKSLILYAYMISAVSSQGVEAARPPQIAVFGVPYVKTPGQPRLRLQAAPDGSCIQVIALYVQSGEQPAGYRVYRVRDSALTTDAGLMGPPKIEANDPGWAPFRMAPLPSLTQPAARPPATEVGQCIQDLAATPSWYPYYYRIDAIGPQDPANGVYSGWSAPSQLQTGVLTPPNPPLIESPVITQGGGAELIAFTADLPIPVSPLGPSLVELLRADPDPANPGRMVQTTLISIAPDTIAVTTLALPSPPWLQSHGHIVFHPSVGPALARTAPNAAGQWVLSALVPIGSGQGGSYSLRLTDPLGRQNSTVF
jgi:hypothetical protein